MERVDTACARWGEREVVRQCAALLGAPPDSLVTGAGLEMADVLGGLRDPAWINGGRPPGHAYWARVWAARALRYVWDDTASAAVVRALDDEHWRVREMACKVVGDREIADAADDLAALLCDVTPRVRAAAVRALGVIGEGEHGESVRDLASDPDPAVASAARRALRRLADRLDRPF